MDSPTIVNPGLFFLLMSVAMLCLIWEWTHNIRREEACQDCPECKRRRTQFAHERKVRWAKTNNRCPYEGAVLRDGVCTLCETKWW